MHPLAVMGILATLGGLLAAAVALVMVSRQGVPLAPVLVGNGLPLLVFVLGVALSIRQRMRGGRGSAILFAAFALTLVAWWLLNVGGIAG